ncbi:MAG: hypothetical protein P8I82_01895 [Flavobacteriales bacterium]|jgi:hypothetical protein|nr:hypothetical protein [Flavobacteriales bacterium]
MKKYILIFLISIIPINFLNAQDLKDVLFKASYGLDFVGLDFSSVKFIGNKKEYGDPVRLKNEFIPNWNNLFYSQKEKYNIEKEFGKNKVNYLVGNMIEANAILDENYMFSIIPVKGFDAKKIQKIVNRYKFNYENEVGVSLIVHSFDKPSKTATIYVVWFNTKTLKVIKSVRRQVTPKGFGFRNYWAGAIFYTIKNMKKVLKKQHKE